MLYTVLFSELSEYVDSRGKLGTASVYQQHTLQETMLQTEFNTESHHTVIITAVAERISINQ